MTLCELENQRTHSQEKDNDKSAQSPQQVVPKNPIFLLWKRRVLRMYELCCNKNECHVQKLLVEV